MDDVSRGSNSTIYTFCTLILICLLLTSVTWHPKLKKPVTLETKGLQVKNDPTQSEQLTTICSDWVVSILDKKDVAESLAPQGFPGF